MENLFQLYVTDNWGSHASRNNMGVFSSVDKALTSLLEDTDLILDCLPEGGNSRIFVEEITVDETDGYSQVWDSDNETDAFRLKQIIFLDVTQKFSNDLGFLDMDTDELDFNIEDINEIDDVTKDMVETYLGDDNIKNFIKDNLVE